jgi:O-antigen ligase
MKKWHYALVVGLGMLVAILVLSNLGFVFGLFNRSSTMTGRLPLWGYLLSAAYQRPWTGHGFGAPWTLDVFRDAAMRSANWTSQPLIADNGFLDIFLHLGIIGFLAFLTFLILFTIRAVRYAAKEKTLIGFFPLLIAVYAFFANLSFSLFAETEVFIWFLIVSALFMVTARSEKPVV